ncbi:hypothetical protein FRC05_005926 [Tulasnella sp. 425]|nr:hypothetical protein FRC05_005926 [Tulasnella sp. 425]
MVGALIGAKSRIVASTWVSMNRSKIRLQNHPETDDEARWRVKTYGEFDMEVTLERVPQYEDEDRDMGGWATNETATLNFVPLHQNPVDVITSNYLSHQISLPSLPVSKRPSQSFASLLSTGPVALLRGG